MLQVIVSKVLSRRLVHRVYSIEKKEYFTHEYMLITVQLHVPKDSYGLINIELIHLKYILPSYIH